MKKKILFVYDMKAATPWKDGLWAALKLLEKDYEITKLNINLLVAGFDADSGNDDFILGWGAFDSRVDKKLQALVGRKTPMGLCIAGTTNPPDRTAFNYDILFYETEWQKQNDLKGVPHARYAFGVNTDIFHLPDQCERTPDCEYCPGNQKIWDYIGVGSLSTWKRWEKIVSKDGLKLVVGHYQVENEAESAEYSRWLVASDVMVSNEVEPEILAKLYHSSRICYMPSALPGGGERTVWEARACGLNVEVEEDNPKLQSLLTIPVLDHHAYAKALKEGIESVI